MVAFTRTVERGELMKYEVTAEMNLKTIIAESREVAKVLLDFADVLTAIDKKYSAIEGKGENYEQTTNEST